MFWTMHQDFANDCVTCVASDDGDGYLAVTRSGRLVAGSWDGSSRTLGQAKYPLLAVTTSEGVISATGLRGTLLIGTKEHLQDEMIEDGSDLTSVVSLTKGRWLIAGKSGHRSGALFAGNQGSWTRISAGYRVEEMQVVANEGGLNCLAAGGRGFLVRVQGAQLKQLRTETMHALRAIASGANVAYVGGGGWAQQMPILLKVENEVVTPLLIAGGARVIIGLALVGENLWLADMRTDGKAWGAHVSRFGAPNDADETVFANQRVTGMIALGSRLVIWGDGGFLAWTQVG